MPLANGRTALHGITPVAPSFGGTMRGRLTVLLLVTLLIFPAAAFADGHKADFFGGGSGGTGGSKLGGITQSLVFGLGREGCLWMKDKNCPWLGITANDLSVQFGGENGKELTQMTLQWGGRATLTSFKVPNPDTPIKVFVQGALGLAYTNDGTEQSGTNFVGSVGGGIQWFPNKLPHPDGKGEMRGGFGLQAQADYIFRTTRSGYWRGAAGVVYRFLHHK